MFVCINIIYLWVVVIMYFINKCIVLLFYVMNEERIDVSYDNVIKRFICFDVLCKDYEGF